MGIRATVTCSVTVYDVRGHGRQKGHREIYRGQEYEFDLLPKVKLEIVVADDRVDETVATLVEAARTPTIGDGKVFVYPIEGAIRIRTNETGKQPCRSRVRKPTIE